ncbi:MAG TPA: S1 RNA-binding domain-containing protein [Anaerolineae bacterium]|jgi:transcriptional accessory protein Tex/SPT6|nr:S1 RNA-binding domain-containing protein [Anaerolineae bacterium]
MAEEVVGFEDQAEEPASAPVTAVSGIRDLKPKMKLTGTVERLELYGAFVDLGAGTSAILHISKMGKRVNRVSDVLAIGDEVDVWVESVDPGKEQITVTMQEPLAVEWSDLQVGQTYDGTVTRLEKFGAFIDIGAEKEGLVHISELNHEYVKHPSEAVKVGEEIQVRVLGFNKRKRRIDLSRKALLESADAELPEVDDIEAEEEVALPTAMEIALRRAMGNGDEAPVPAKKKSAPRSGSQQKRDVQDDILSRTLKLSQDAPE